MKCAVGIMLRKTAVGSKISFKLIVFIILISIIPLFFMGIVFNSQIQEYYADKLDESYEQVIEQYTANLNYKIDIYQTLVYNIVSNRTLSELIETDNIESYTDVYDIGSKISKEVGSLLGARNMSELRNIMVYLYKEDIPIYSSKVTNVKFVKNNTWYKKMCESGTKRDYFIYTNENPTCEILSFTKQIVGLKDKNYGQKLGFVKLDIKIDSFFKAEGSFQKKYGKDIFVIDDKSILWTNYKDNSDFAIQKIRGILADNFGKSGVEISGKEKIILYKTVPKFGWKVVYLFDNEEFSRQVTNTRKISSFYIMVLSILMSILTILFSKKFTGRLDLLIRKMEKVENGDLYITEVIEGNDEISVVDNHFNKMVNRLKELIDSNYIQQLERREAELNALQFQINPHFLYNTLESINSLAAVNGCFEICEISHKLGEMFRYSTNISSSDFVTLESEIRHIENYVYIQKIRFKDQFEVFYNIDDYARSCNVLKFILQPIVENSIVHGFEQKMGSGCLEISAYVQNGSLLIIIEDDGNGMTEEQVENLNNYINERDECLITGYRKSIGVKNVNMRIKLACGNEYGVLIKSRKDKGTQVTLTLPAHI